MTFSAWENELCVTVLSQGRSHISYFCYCFKRASDDWAQDVLLGNVREGRTGAFSSQVCKEPHLLAGVSVLQPLLQAERGCLLLVMAEPWHWGNQMPRRSFCLWRSQEKLGRRESPPNFTPGCMCISWVHSWVGVGSRELGQEPEHGLHCPLLARSCAGSVAEVEEWAPSGAHTGLGQHAAAPWLGVEALRALRLWSPVTPLLLTL